MEIPTFRFNFWLENYEEYNCSALGDIDWSSRGTSRPYFGVFCILFGITTIPLYLVCAQTMLPMRNLSVYKIMLFLAAVDILNLIHGAIIFGIMLITGQVFCAHPRLQLLFAFGCEITFFCSNLSCALLSLNRFGEMLGIRFLTWLFEGSRTWLVLLTCTIPYCFVIVYTPPMLFNSNSHMIQHDPQITEGKYIYKNEITFWVVTILPLTSLVVYSSTLIGLIHKHGSISKARNSKGMSSATFRIAIQSGIIIAIHLTTLVAFEILPFFPPEAVDSMLYVAHCGWMLVHGSPSIVYMAMNQTIRGKIFQQLNERRVNVVGKSASHQTSHAAVTK